MGIVNDDEIQLRNETRFNCAGKSLKKLNEGLKNVTARHQSEWSHDLMSWHLPVCFVQVEVEVFGEQGLYKFKFLQPRREDTNCQKVKRIRHSGRV